MRFFHKIDNSMFVDALNGIIWTPGKWPLNQCLSFIWNSLTKLLTGDK